MRFSMDDSIVTKQNHVLLENLTNYDKQSIDYFHHGFRSADYPVSWRILLKMKRQRILRLPSCARENCQDYRNYILRLHYCLWRRWSIQQFDLERIDPLAINWNKENDLNVLYGPDLTGQAPLHGRSHSNGRKQLLEDYIRIHDIAQMYAIKSSQQTNWQERFNRIHKSRANSSSTLPPMKGIKFDKLVLRRDIDIYGVFHESTVDIRDKGDATSLRPSHSVDGVYVVEQKYYLYDDRYLFPYMPDEDPLECDAPKDFGTGSFSTLEIDDQLVSS